MEPDIRAYMSASSLYSLSHRKHRQHAPHESAGVPSTLATACLHARGGCAAVAQGGGRAASISVATRVHMPSVAAGGGVPARLRHDAGNKGTGMGEGSPGVARAATRLSKLYKIHVKGITLK
jgi:hypothetical protein